MKLRKSLYKARQQRGERVERIIDPPQFAMQDDQAAAQDGWQPPVYHKSTRINLDHQLVINNRCVCIEPKAPELDSYKVLRTKIQQLTQDKGWNTVMITSPRAGEGKTLTAINLSLTFSKAYNQTVLLVDCDLRRQNIHKVLGIESKAGLIDHLVDDVPMQNFIIWPGIDKLTLISGGRDIQNSSELLGSPRMKSLVHEMKSRYADRYVIFDVPPILLGADAMALAPFIDCIVMVVEEGKTANHDVQKALEMIPPEKFLGFVLNRQSGHKGAEGNYGYYR